MNWFHTKSLSINLDRVTEILWMNGEAKITVGTILDSGGDENHPCPKNDFHFIRGNDFERLKALCGYRGYEAEQAAKAKRAAEDLEYAKG